MRRMNAAVNLLWLLLSVLGAFALAHVVGVVNPHEKVNGLWLVVAAGRLVGLAWSIEVQATRRSHPTDF
jgi:carbon starvation protein